MITSQRAVRSAFTLAIAAGITVLLSGCFSNPLENLADGLIEDTVENAIEGSTGVDVDIDADGTGGSLPESWPDAVPVPAGNIIFALAAGGSYSAVVTVGTDAAAQAGYEKLLAEGYEVTSEMSLGEGAYAYGLTRDDWTVQYSWGLDEDVATINITATPVEG